MNGITETYCTDRFFRHIQIMVKFFIKIEGSVFISECEDVSTFQSEREELFLMFQVFLHLFFMGSFSFIQHSLVNNNDYQYDSQQDCYTYNIKLITDIKGDIYNLAVYRKFIEADPPLVEYFIIEYVLFICLRNLRKVAYRSSVQYRQYGWLPVLSVPAVS